MKKPILILSAVALVLILLTGGFLWLLLSQLPGAAAPRNGDVETYIAEHWTFYQFRSWDQKTGRLELEYTQPYTYDQAVKYGADLGFSEDALAQTDHLQNVRIGLAETCGVRAGQIVLHGLSSDGREVYTVDSDGALTACWDPQP